MASSKRKKARRGLCGPDCSAHSCTACSRGRCNRVQSGSPRVKALQAGAAFTFDYEITSTADSPALYTILQKTGSTKGTVNGLYAPDALQLSISAPDAVIPAGPLTRVYISSSETLYDVGQLYKKYPLFHHRQLPAGEPSAAGLEPWQLYLAGPAGKPAGCGHHSHQPAGHDRV